MAKNLFVARSFNLKKKPQLSGYAVRNVNTGSAKSLR